MPCGGSEGGCFRVVSSRDGWWGGLFTGHEYSRARFLKDLHGHAASFERLHLNDVPCTIRREISITATGRYCVNYCSVYFPVKCSAG